MEKVSEVKEDWMTCMDQFLREENMMRYMVAEWVKEQRKDLVCSLDKGMEEGDSSW